MSLDYAEKSAEDIDIPPLIKKMKLDQDYNVCFTAKKAV